MDLSLAVYNSDGSTALVLYYIYLTALVTVK